MKVNNIELPEPQALDIEYNKIWSQNTGRLDSGYFYGDLIAIKRKLNIKWGPTTREDAKKIKEACCDEFAYIEFTNPEGKPETGMFYWGDLSGSYYNYTVERIMSGFSCNAIER